MTLHANTFVCYNCLTYVISLHILTLCIPIFKYYLQTNILFTGYTQRYTAQFRNQNFICPSHQSHGLWSNQKIRSLHKKQRVDEIYSGLKEIQHTQFIEHSHNFKQVTGTHLPFFLFDFIKYNLFPGIMFVHNLWMTLHFTIHFVYKKFVAKLRFCKPK